MINEAIKCSLFFVISFAYFLNEVEKLTFSLCFCRVIETLVKIWENSKKPWKQSPAVRVPTAFFVPPNFHSCFYNSIETLKMFYFS